MRLIRSLPVTAILTLGFALLPVAESVAQGDIHMDCTGEGPERPGVVQSFGYVISPGRGVILRGAKAKVSYALKLTPEAYVGERVLEDTTKIVISIDKTTGAFKRTIYRSDGDVFDSKEGTCTLATKP